MELLAPAGNIEKLQVAFRYGADACYVGGTVFGLRKFADNFSDKQLRQAVDIARESGKKVYVVLNGFAHNEDLEALKPHLDVLERVQPHGLIISDMGVFQQAKAQTSIDLHVSTQASVTSIEGCQMWKDAGAKRVILAREVSILEMKAMKAAVDIELETFVHGSMCASYSGKCVISNYTAGRDSNRGGCIQSCRHRYEVIDKEIETVEYRSHIMNAKDLMGVSVLPELYASGVDSLKIEGRMKSNLYVANVVSVYRAAMDAVMAGDSVDSEASEAALKRVSNRTFSAGGLSRSPQAESIHYDFSGYEKSVEHVATVVAVHAEKGAVLSVKQAFSGEDNLFVLGEGAEEVDLNTFSLQNMVEEGVSSAKQNTYVRLGGANFIRQFDVVYRSVFS